jgi:hypothetical protein
MQYLQMSMSRVSANAMRMDGKHVQGKKTERNVAFRLVQRNILVVRDPRLQGQE